MFTIADNCNVYGSNNIKQDLANFLKPYEPKGRFLLLDEGTEKYCLPHVVSLLTDGTILEKNVIVIKQGDESKNIESVMKVWEHLSQNGATRKSVLVNLGGGMVTDLGGFAASCFKRGIDFINIPTTVLAQVDASLGGKTGMNLGGLKNEIGTFNMASKVLVSGDFLKTLSKDELLSGFAEMLKHALIYEEQSIRKLLSIDWNNIDYSLLSHYIGESIMIKNYFVTNDPKEQGLRKALNFGHTFGHAFETYAMRHGSHMPHGHAVAYGTICEIYISCKMLGLEVAKSQEIIDKIRCIYPTFKPTPDMYPELLELMTHDKKNDSSNGINFSLLRDLGKVEVNHVVSNELIMEAFNAL